MNHNGSDWNRHGGVGATLLENWVEERAVGDKVIEERNVRLLSRAGHKGVLVHTPNGQDPAEDSDRMISVAQKAYRYESDPKKAGLGKRRAMLEAELFNRAIDEVQLDLLPTSHPSEWISTTHKDFQKDFRSALSDEEISNINRNFLEQYNLPVTYWSAEFGTGEIISSSSPQKSSQLDGEGAPFDIGRVSKKFGRHHDFSTPIQSYVKSAVKDL